MRRIFIAAVICACLLVLGGCGLSDRLNGGMSDITTVTGISDSSTGVQEDGEEEVYFSEPTDTSRAEDEVSFEDIDGYLTSRQPKEDSERVKDKDFTTKQSTTSATQAKPRSIVVGFRCLSDFKADRDREYVKMSTCSSNLFEVSKEYFDRQDIKYEANGEKNSFVKLDGKYVSDESSSGRWIVKVNNSFVGEDLTLVPVKENDKIDWIYLSY